MRRYRDKIQNEPRLDRRWDGSGGLCGTQLTVLGTIDRTVTGGKARAFSKYRIGPPNPLVSRSAERFGAAIAR